MERAGDPGGVRLAELVAALSLGIDLGFSQPMEHVLRQCLIALRLAERVGVDEDTRASVYYAALLVNVGCHSDAHEQAKWFGDDLEMKSDKYVYGLRGLRGAVAMLSRIGSGSDTTIGKMRVRMEFATSGYKDVDDMISNHAALAGQLAGDLALPPETQRALGSSYEMWDGHGWPGELQGEAIPVSSRIATMSEYIEVAHRCTASTPPATWSAGTAASSSTPRSPTS